MNKSFFDNVVLSENAWADMVEKVRSVEEPQGVLGGILVVTSVIMADDTMLLRQGKKVVAVIHIRAKKKYIDREENNGQ